MGPSTQAEHSASCMQRVRHWPFTHCSPSYWQSRSIEHSETRRQSGRQICSSQKSAGLAHVMSS